MMKKIINLVLVAALTASVLLLSACGKTTAPPKEESGKISIVCTIFPLYDWMKQLAGDNADVKLLLDSGVDLHSYQPTTQDMVAIADCDMFVYVGGESDEWVPDALANAANEKQVAVNLMEVLGDNAKEEEAVEGMQTEEEAEEGEEETEYDEHIWLSVKNAEILVKTLAEKLEQADAAHAAAYRQNAESYEAQLAALSKAYEDSLGSVANKALVFGDRFPFRYLADDYAITYYAAFSGCSAESEASFETVSFLAKKADELGVKCIMTIDGSDRKIAQTIINNTQTKNQTILTLDSMQSATAEDIAQGKTYVAVMQQNLSVLQEAFA